MQKLLDIKLNMINKFRNILNIRDPKFLGSSNNLNYD